MPDSTQRQIDAALDLILAQALRARARAIELQDMLSLPSYTPEAKGRASAFATLVELEVNELVRQAEKLQVERSKVAPPPAERIGVLTPEGVRVYDYLGGHDASRTAPRRTHARRASKGNRTGHT
jgi:hypothetical protein